MRKILQTIPTEILDMVMANLLSEKAEHIKSTRYICESWLTQDGKPQQRTIQITPQCPSF